VHTPIWQRKGQNSCVKLCHAVNGLTACYLTDCSFLGDAAHEDMLFTYPLGKRKDKSAVSGYAMRSLECVWVELGI